MGFGQSTLEGLVSMSASNWHGRSVFVTGHTGFKGSWITLWLHHLGAAVHGYATRPPTAPNLFEVAGIQALLASDTRADLSDVAALRSALERARPEVIFHLAAQPLVRESYRDPIGTFTTNVLGTAHVLEAARKIETVRAIVLITTDKVYENRHWVYPYREIDPLGGHDPYSASKAAAEIVSAAYRASFFSESSLRTIRVATARAGNVIGGGDWAADRLIPDCFRGFENKEPVLLRYPDAVRPWQHVLDPLAGYLQLAQRLCLGDGQKFAAAWNFGPDAESDATVGQIAELAAHLWGDDAKVVRAESTHNPHEAGLLRLDSSRARAELGWRPRWSLQKAVLRAVTWHRSWERGADMRAVSLEQIREYETEGP